MAQGFGSAARCLIAAKGADVADIAAFRTGRLDNFFYVAVVAVRAGDGEAFAEAQHIHRDLLIAGSVGVIAGNILRQNGQETYSAGSAFQHRVNLHILQRRFHRQRFSVGEEQIHGGVFGFFIGQEGQFPAVSCGDAGGSRMIECAVQHILRLVYKPALNRFRGGQTSVDIKIHGVISVNAVFIQHVIQRVGKVSFRTDGKPFPDRLLKHVIARHGSNAVIEPHPVGLHQQLPLVSGEIDVVIQGFLPDFAAAAAGMHLVHAGNIAFRPVVAQGGKGFAAILQAADAAVQQFRTALPGAGIFHAAAQLLPLVRNAHRGNLVKGITVIRYAFVRFQPDSHCISRHLDGSSRCLGAGELRDNFTVAIFHIQPVPAVLQGRFLGECHRNPSG